MWPNLRATQNGISFKCKEDQRRGFYKRCMSLYWTWVLSKENNFAKRVYQRFAKAERALAKGKKNLHEVFFKLHVIFFCSTILKSNDFIP